MASEPFSVVPSVRARTGKLLLPADPLEVGTFARGADGEPPLGSVPTLTARGLTGPG
jgi:hypothetical protein